MDGKPVTLHSEWNPSTSILRTTLSGPVTGDDVFAWRAGLEQQEAGIPGGRLFGVLLDLRDFAPIDIAAHKAMRTVIPELLARHGMRPAFIDLFDERPEMTITCVDDARCIAFANVHHDETKMANYEARIGSENQRFFTDVAAAEHWLQRRMQTP